MPQRTPDAFPWMGTHLHGRRQGNLGLRARLMATGPLTNLKLSAPICKHLQHHFALRLGLIFTRHLCSVQITEYSPKFVPGTALAQASSCAKPLRLCQLASSLPCQQLQHVCYLFVPTSDSAPTLTPIPKGICHPQLAAGTCTPRGTSQTHSSLQKLLRSPSQDPLVLTLPQAVLDGLQNKSAPSFYQRDPVGAPGPHGGDC